MGFSYLGDETVPTRRWSEVTREERTFCGHLAARIGPDGVNGFVRFLCDRVGLDVDPDCEWELAPEVAFYRDCFHARGRSAWAAGYSPKRTFDLCLLSEKTIVIVEAKAQCGFDSVQLENLKYDREDVQMLTGARVLTVAIVSNRYRPKGSTRDVFDAVVTWQALASQFGEDGRPDRVLLRADAIYRR